MSIPAKLILGILIANLVACDQAAQVSDHEDSVSTSARIELEGSNWQLVKITVAGGYVFTPNDPGKYVLNFRSENRLTGTSDCNQINGSWQQQDVALSFAPFSTSRSLCPPGSLHNTLALHLRDVQAFALRDGHLILTTSTAGIELEFEARGSKGQ